MNRDNHKNVPEYIIREQELIERRKSLPPEDMSAFMGIYEYSDSQILPQYTPPDYTKALSLESLEDLVKRDVQREKDGFRRRIRFGKLVKPLAGNKSKVIVVPTTTEPKFYHDDSISKEEETGGSGEGQEGEVIGQQKAQPQQGQGSGNGAGQGEGGDHEVMSEAFDLGKVLTQQFKLPNIKEKGKKRSMTKFTYELTDRNRGFGQLLDKKSTLRRIVETNLQLGNIDPDKGVDPEELVIANRDLVYRILSKEVDFDNQAVVFFVRDYSGSMEGKPTEAVTNQHLLIYSWLMYQYQNNVMTRFIVHDTEAKEVSDFYNYFRLQVAGGTKVAPAFELVNKIIEQESLSRDYNIYIFYGTDGDDWDSDGKELMEQLGRLFPVVSRIGFTIAKNSWTGENETTVEKYIKQHQVAEKHGNEFRIDGFSSTNAGEERIIESIRKLIS